MAIELTGFPRISSIKESQGEGEEALIWEVHLFGFLAKGVGTYSEEGT